MIRSLCRSLLSCSISTGPSGEPRMLAVEPKEKLYDRPPFPEMVSELVAQFMDQWAACPACLPNLGPEYSLRQQMVNESQLNYCLNRVAADLKRRGPSRPGQQEMRRQFLPLAAGIAKA